MSDDAAVAALMSSFDPPKGSAAPTAGDAEDEGNEGDDEDGAVSSAEDLGEYETEEGDESDTGDGEEGEGDEGAAAAAAEIADDAVVKFTVDGQEQTATVGALKRLAGQEAALTRKSQEADLVGGRAAAALQAALASAVEDFQPYQDVDWLTLQTEVDPETFKWHRENAMRASKRYQAIVEQAQGFEQALQERQQADFERRATESRQLLATEVPGWNDTLDSEVRAYGIAQGLEAGDVAKIANAPVLKLLHKAMLYDRGAKAAAVKVKEAPAKVLRTGTRDTSTAKTTDTRKAEQRLSRSGSDADAMAVLMGRWG